MSLLSQSLQTLMTSISLSGNDVEKSIRAGYEVFLGTLGKNVPLRLYIQLYNKR